MLVNEAVHCENCGAALYQLNRLGVSGRDLALFCCGCGERQADFQVTER